MTKFDTIFLARNSFIAPELTSQSKLAKEVAHAFENAPHSIQCAQKYKQLQSEDTTLTQGQKRARLAEYAKLVQAEAIGTINKQLRRAADRVAYLSQNLEAAYKPSDQATETRRNGVCDSLAKMERVERDSRIRQALMNGERDIIESIASRPQNNRVCSSFQYAECRTAFEKLAVGNSEYEEFKDLQAASAQLKTARANLQAVMDTEFINAAEYATAQAAEASEMFDRAAMSAEGD